MSKVKAPRSQRQNGVIEENERQQTEADKIEETSKVDSSHLFMRFNELFTCVIFNNMSSPLAHLLLSALPRTSSALQKQQQQ